jgi:hypothetical protein
MQLPIVPDDMSTSTCRLITGQNRWDIGKRRCGKGSRRERIPCFGCGMRSLLGEATMAIQPQIPHGGQFRGAAGNNLSNVQ